MYRMAGNIGGNDIWRIRHFPNFLRLADFNLVDQGTAISVWAGLGTAATACNTRSANIPSDRIFGRFKFGGLAAHSLNRQIKFPTNISGHWCVGPGGHLH